MTGEGSQSRPFDVLVSGGRVVDGQSSIIMDVAITDGRIVALGELVGRFEADATIDATGLLVLPGIVDGHFHCAAASASPVADDMEQGTISAVHGGVTTVLVHVFGDREQPMPAALKQFIANSGSTSVIDYGIHCGVRPEPDLIAKIPEVVGLGVRTFKFHLDYRKTGDGRMFDTDLLLAGMEQVASVHGLAIVHAEDGHVIDHLENVLSARGEDSAAAFLPTRPEIVEEMAIERVAALAELSGCPVLFAHLSSGRGAARLAALQTARRGLHAETQPHYLVLTDADMQRIGPMAKVGPPLRSAADNSAVWNSVRNGVVAALSSDHVAYMQATKEAAGPHFLLDTPFGMPGVETMLGVVYTHGVLEGRLTLPQMVRAFSEAPARRFGIFPQKGSLRMGADADVVLFDPAGSQTVTASALHSTADFTPYEGWKLKGEIVAVYQRGRCVVDRGELIAAPGDGAYLRQSEVDHFNE